MIDETLTDGLNIGLITRIPVDELGGVNTYLNNLIIFLKFHNINMRNVYIDEKRLNTVVYNFKLINKLKESPNKFDIFHGQMFDGFLWSILNKNKSKPYIVSLHGVHFDELLNSIKYNYKPQIGYSLMSLFSILEGLNARKADYVIAPSKYAALKAINNYRIDWSKIRVVPHGIGKDFLSINVKREIKVPYNILFIGRMYDRKGLSFLLRAIASMDKRKSLIKLEIVGGGEKLEFYKKMAKELDLSARVQFYGEVNSEKLKEILKKSDIFIIPSFQEGFGIGGLEAAAAGLAIISSKVGIMPEIIINGKNGFLFDVGDVKGLKDQLYYLIDNPSEIYRLGKNIQNDVKIFTWERSALMHKKIYTECI
jgi:teichuronic acid biosynthesis glycosyltransferase TuaC